MICFATSQGRDNMVCNEDVGMKDRFAQFRSAIRNAIESR